MPFKKREKEKKERKKEGRPIDSSKTKSSERLTVKSHKIRHTSKQEYYNIRGSLIRADL